MAGVAPRYRTWEGGDSIEELVAYVVSANLHRRHLDESQRAMVAARAIATYEAEARKRQEATRAKPGDQVGQASANWREPMPDARQPKKPPAVVNVSTRTVEHAIKVVEKGSPELQQAVERGEVDCCELAETVGGIFRNSEDRIPYGSIARDRSGEGA